MGRKAINISGHTYGDWTVIERDYNYKNPIRWVCKNNKTNEIKSMLKGSLETHEQIVLKNKESRWLVYKHTSPSGKSYIGITSHKNPNRRWGRDGGNYIKNKSQIKFSGAIQKYGWNNFTHEILQENLNYKEAQRFEKVYIKKYDSYVNGYNATKGGEHSGMLGKKHSTETKEKISKYFTGRFVGKLNPMYGVHNNHICDENGNLPQYIKDKLSIKAKDRIKNPKEKERLQSYNENKKKKVFKYSIDGVFLKKYESIHEASSFENITVKQISECCIKERQTHGYMFRFNCGDFLDIPPYSKKISSCEPKMIVIDNIIYNSISDCKKHKNLCGMLSCYLSGSRPMPQKYLDRGLRYYNPETDKDLPIYVDTKNEV